MLLSLVRMDPTPDAIYTVVSGGTNLSTLHMVACAKTRLVLPSEKFP